MSGRMLFARYCKPPMIGLNSVLLFCVSSDSLISINLSIRDDAVLHFDCPCLSMSARAYRFWDRNRVFLEWLVI